MEPKNKNTANQKQSFNLLTVLSLCAIVTSTTTAAIEQLSKKQDFVPTGEQQTLNQDFNNHLDKNDDVVLEEIDLDKEWQGIFGDDESGQGFLIAGCGGCRAI
ncbi:hypothetical protein ACF3DV_07895 [Chlorogloeopsis fritschii PCC 9212]|uniref:Uncharacterized protein n=1 Tax=Chlorogloeopsis fritschii PCC 6912 TaxID=211165 RepID=A0A433N724_CHLFR|nr:hypothetical protein [Chlorogloeopsis fritschii]RUR77434.1 hypothetical protein PCC6912_38250 [Chlorogloeopsis fritschii PCC 6912]